MASLPRASVSGPPAGGFGGVAVLMAALASGFVPTAVFERIFEGEGAESVYRALGVYTALINQQAACRSRCRKGPESFGGIATISTYFFRLFG